jgi:hypothetical protein
MRIKELPHIIDKITKRAQARAGCFAVMGYTKAISEN